MNEAKKQRLMMLVGAGILMLAAMGSWIWFRESKNSETESFQPPPPIGPSAQPSRMVPIATSGQPPIRLPIAQPTTPIGSRALTVGTSTPSTQTPAPITSSATQPPRTPPPPTVGATGNSATITPATTVPSTACKPPQPISLPSLESGEAAAKERQELAVRSKAHAQLLKAWREKQEGSLYAFLFNNLALPDSEAPPVMTAYHGSGSSPKVYRATTMLEAVAKAKASIAPRDPSEPIPLTLTVPWNAPKAVAVKSTDWVAVLGGNPQLPEIPGAPNPHFPGLEIPPPPPSVDGGLPIIQLPLPPDKPSGMAIKFKLVAILGEVALFTVPGHKDYVRLSEGEEYEGVRLQQIKDHSVLLDDGGSQQTKWL